MPETRHAPRSPEEPGEPPGNRRARFTVQNRQRGFPVDAPGLARFLRDVADDVAPGDPRDATLRIVSDRVIRDLNRRYRGRDRPTDVLAFPADPMPPGEPPYLGDLAISADAATRQAAAREASPDEEFRVLALHGLLHLLGYDHEKDNGEMNRLERLLRLRHGLGAGSAPDEEAGSRSVRPDIPAEASS